MAARRPTVPAQLQPPRLEIRHLPTDSLVHYATNPRRNDPAVDRLVPLLREFGLRAPLLVHDIDGRTEVVDGHLRLKAATKLGLAEVPTVDVSDLSEAQIRSLRLAMNKSAEFAEWDDELLAAELRAIEALGMGLDLTGFGDEELARLLNAGSEGLTDPDEVPDPPADPVTRLGDVWLLGRHRLACGDSTERETVERALGGVRPHLMVTDPPYGVSYDPDWRNRADRANGKPYGASAIGKVGNDDRADWSEAWALFPGDVAYVWHADRYSPEVAGSLANVGFEMRALIVWGKNQMVISRGHYHSQHEPCWYAVRKNATGHWSGGRKQTTLWQIDKPRKSETGHSTQKPVECMKRPIENNSSPGQAVYEPFCGSGTTIIAAEMTGRSCLAIELSPAYVDVCVLRWQAFTGQEALLEATAQTFAELAADRGVVLPAGQLAGAA